MLEIHEGTPVESTDGRRLGTVDRFIVDPSSRTVTHGIVEKGVFFTDEKVIPIQALERGAGDEILTLRPEIAPADLPDVEEPHYVELDTDTRNRLVPHASRAYAWSHPVLTTTGYPVYPRDATYVDADRNRGERPRGQACDPQGNRGVLGGRSRRRKDPRCGTLRRRSTRLHHDGSGLLPRRADHP